MTIRLIPFLIFIFAFHGLRGQSDAIIINQNIVLPKDSLECKNLISALNDFLIAAKESNEVNKFIPDSQKIETFIQLDEIKNIERNDKYNDDHFYKPYLTNLFKLGTDQYFIYLSYIGISENKAFLRASFEFIGYKLNSTFSFSSPLRRNTRIWKTEKAGNIIFHFQNKLEETKAREYSELSSLFDKKLKAEGKVTELYCGENISELQKLVGVDYKSDYNGRSESVWSSSLGKRTIIILGNNNATFSHFDQHDLWHDRLNLVISRTLVNRAVDEGCAYIYGGSWELSWKQIFTEFKAQISVNKETNWTGIKENPIYFKTNGFKNSADYIVNALLVKKIESEKGFEGVWEFLNCGKTEKGNDNYYKALEKLTGITKADYNNRVWELINREN